MATEESFYDEKTLKVLRRVLDGISDNTWHKIMNPYCGQCLTERGRAILEGTMYGKTDNASPQTNSK